MIWVGSSSTELLQHALQVKGVPLISFDVGGIGEMLEYAEHEDVMVMESTAEALSQKLQGDSHCTFSCCTLQSQHCTLSLSSPCPL